MKFQVQREVFLRPLQQVVGVVERRHTLAILGNLLLRAGSTGISLTGTDLEMEMVASLDCDVDAQGEMTIPARKLFDICRALPDGSRLTLEQKGERVQLSAGRSRYTLATLPASDFPAVDELELGPGFSIREAVLKRLLDRTAFAMAQQDVRYYLNGVLLELSGDRVRCVATDGHRMAVTDCEAVVVGGDGTQVIVPRKGVQELQRLLEGSDRELAIELSRNHVRLRLPGLVMTSKLIDGRFPDYDAVIPIGADKRVVVDREQFKGALMRAAILSNEKYRGVKLEMARGILRVVAHNPEQEEAFEELEADTDVDGLSLGFNVNYLMEALNALDSERVQLALRDSNSSCLMTSASDESSRQIIMPLRL